MFFSRFRLNFGDGRSLFFFFLFSLSFPADHDAEDLATTRSSTREKTMILDKSNNEKDVLKIDDNHGNSIILPLSDPNVARLAKVYGKPSGDFPAARYKSRVRQFLRELCGIPGGSASVLYKGFLTHGALSGSFQIIGGKVQGDFSKVVHDLDLAIFAHGIGGLILTRTSSANQHFEGALIVADVLCAESVNESGQSTRLTPAQTRFINNYDYGESVFLQQEVNVLYGGNKNWPDIDCTLKELFEPPSHCRVDDPGFTSLQLGIPIRAAKQHSVFAKTGGEKLAELKGGGALHQKVNTLIRILNGMPGRKRLTIMPQITRLVLTQPDIVFMSSDHLTSQISATVCSLLKKVFKEMGGTITIRTYTDDVCNDTHHGIYFVRMLQIAPETHEIRVLPAGWVRFMQNSKFIGFGANGPIKSPLSSEPGVVFVDDEIEIPWTAKQRPPTEAEARRALMPFEPVRLRNLANGFSNMSI